MTVTLDRGSVRYAISRIAERLYQMREQAIAEGWTFERIIDYRRQYVHEDHAYGKLPQWAKREVSLRFSIMDGDIQKSLVWTHVLDGRRIHKGDPALNGRLDELDAEDSHFAHPFLTKEGNVVFLAYHQEDRQEDMDLDRCPFGAAKGWFDGSKRLFPVMGRRGEQLAFLQTIGG